MTGRDGYVAVLSEDPELDGSHAQNHSTEQVYFTPAPEQTEHGHENIGPKMLDMLTMQKRSWYSKQEAVKTFIKDNAGLLLVMLAQLFFAVMDASVKQLHSLDDPVPTLELIFVRMSMTYILCMAYMWARSVPDPFLGPKGVRLLLVLRGIFGFFGLFGIYYSLQYLSLSDATVLTFLTPSLTAIVAALFLGEKLSLKIVGAGLCSFLGVILIARPPLIFGDPVAEVDSDGSLSRHVTPEQRLAAVGVAILGAVGAAGAYTTIAAIGKRSHAAHSMAYFSLMCSIVSPIGMLVTRTPFVIPTQTEWIVLFLVIGTFGFFGQMLLITGFQREAAGRASMGIYLLVVFALIFERFVFHVQPPLLSIAGIVIILGSAIFIALNKEKPAASPTKPEDIEALTPLSLPEEERA